MNEFTIERRNNTFLILIKHSGNTFSFTENELVRMNPELIYDKIRYYVKDEDIVDRIYRELMGGGRLPVAAPPLQRASVTWGDPNSTPIQDIIEIKKLYELPRMPRVGDRFEVTIKENKENAMDRKEVIKNSLARLEDELASINRWGEDIYENGTILKIRRKYVGGDIKYTYAAIKAGNRWTVTSDKRNYMITWGELISFFNENTASIKVTVLSGEGTLLFKA